MGITVDELLAGPRGRRLCLNVALEIEASRADEGGEPSPLGHRPVYDALWEVTRAFTPKDAGVGYFVGFEGGGRVSRRDRRLAQRAVEAETAALRADPEPSVRAFTAALDIAGSELGPADAPDSDLLVRALAQSVDAARGWQDPDGTDLALTLPDVRRALAPFAEAVAHAPSSAWWDRELQLDGQWLAVRAEDHLEGLEAASPPEQVWDGWRRGRLHGEAHGDRSHWWSTPATGDLARTHGAFPEPDPSSVPSSEQAAWDIAGLPTVAVWEEDGMGLEDGLDALRVTPPETPRLLELRGGPDWIALCARYPLPLTASWGQVARESVGPDPVRGAGTWVIPDWSLLARDYDAVHLSVAAYLSSTGTLLEVPGLGATAISGWDPDETYWLTRLPEQGDPSSANGRLRRWILTDSGGFAQATARA